MEETIKHETIYEGKILNLHLDEVLLENGKRGKREIVDHNGGAAVLCERDGKIIFVRQYRYAYKKEILEIPAGKLKKGEDPFVAARREFEEETGLIAGKMKKLFCLYPSPGYSNEVIYVFLAEDVKVGEQNLDEDEFLSVVEIPKEEAIQMALEGKIEDSKTLAAVLYWGLKSK